MGGMNSEGYQTRASGGNASVIAPDKECEKVVASTEDTNSESGSGLHKDLKIDDFLLIEKLGSGGMGEVWKARQMSMKRDVALKILSPELSRNESFVKRFLNEAEMTGKLWHPNIIPAYTAGNSGKYYYLATLYIDGIELLDKIRIDGTLPEREALSIVKAVASALCYAWEEHRLLHCDIKPANIMIDRYRVPHLMDLGISKVFSEEDVSPDGTLLVGSLQYMSPEQIAANVKLDLRTDIYSLGVTLYQMVTARLPFDNKSLEDALAGKSGKDLPPPNKHNPYLSEGCVALISQMMAYEREDRHSDWNYVIADIDAVMAGTYFVGKKIKRAKWDSIKSKRKDFVINAPINLNKNKKGDCKVEITTEDQSPESTQKIEREDIPVKPEIKKDPPPVAFEIGQKKKMDLKLLIIIGSIILGLIIIAIVLFFIFR
jgi:serine/threonine-protein kinase